MKTTTKPFAFRPGIWLEEYFFDLKEDQMVEFIEKYYPYVATRLTKEKMAYTYSFVK